MILESLISGGLLGVAGGILTNITDIFKQRQINQHEKDLRELDLQAMDKEYEARREESADNLIVASYEHDTEILSKLASKVKMNPVTSFMFVCLEILRGLVRPALTVYLIVLVHLVRGEVNAVLIQAGVDKISIATAMDIYATVIDTILFLASMSVSWWFGTRNKTKK